MAIKKSWTIKGTEFPNCHHRIQLITVGSTGLLHIVLARFATIETKQAGLANALDIAGYGDILYDKSGNQNPHQVAYAYLAALPQYDGSVEE